MSSSSIPRLHRLPIGVIENLEWTISNPYTASQGKFGFLQYVSFTPEKFIQKIEFSKIFDRKRILGSLQRRQVHLPACIVVKHSDERVYVPLQSNFGLSQFFLVSYQQKVRQR